jgi:hypothetical protein
MFFHRKLRAAGMPFGGLVINRVHAAPDGAVPESLGGTLGARVAETARELTLLAERDAHNVERLRRELGDPPALVVPELQDDVHDVDGLARMRAHLFDG